MGQHVNTEIMNITVNFTDEEMNEKKIKLADAVGELKTLESDMSDLKAEIKDRMERLMQ